jgi:hypothetical protein
VLIKGFSPGVATAILILAAIIVALPMPAGAQFPQRGGRQGDPGGRDGWAGSERGKQEWIDRLGKILAYQAGLPDQGTDSVFLIARAGELFERAKQVRGTSFQFDRMARAVDALLRACGEIADARKTGTGSKNFKRRGDMTADDEKRNASEFLQRCYFRIQQADFFADNSGEKESKKYVTTARSLYQQARSAYDARQYEKTFMFGDASSQIVAALENIAHASLNISDPPIIK